MSIQQSSQVIQKFYEMYTLILTYFLHMIVFSVYFRDTFLCIQKGSMPFCNHEQKNGHTACYDNVTSFHLISFTIYIGLSFISLNIIEI